MQRLFFTGIEHEALRDAMDRYKVLDYRDRDYISHNFSWLVGTVHHFHMSLDSLEMLYRAIMIEEINDNAFNILSPKIRKGLFNAQYKIYNILPYQLKKKYEGSILYNKC